MESSFFAEGIYNVGNSLINIGKELSNYLENIEDSSNKLLKMVNVMKGYNGKLAANTYKREGEDVIKHKKWVVNVSNVNFKKPDFVEISKKVSLLTNGGKDLEEVSRKLNEMVSSIEKRLGDKGSIDDYFSGDLDRYCKINKDSTTVTELNPELKRKMKELIKKSEDEGIKIKVIQTVRTVKEQDELYKQGRYQNENGEWVKLYEGTGDDKKALPDANGNYSVTNAKGTDYQSNHQWGAAFDVCVERYKDSDGDWVECTTDKEKFDDVKMAKVGKIGKKIGLAWGGDWDDSKDTPHFELKDFDREHYKSKDPAEYVSTWTSQ